MFATEDMTLVAVLKVAGFEPLEMQQQNGGCRWCYSETEPLLKIVADYQLGDYRVEPRELAKKLGLVRREMYKFIGHTPSRVRS